MERSFGIIPLRYVKENWETLLVKHVKGHWAFPKGHAEENELPKEAAIRELKEETGLDIKKMLYPQPLKEFYLFKRGGLLVEKFVFYFLAEVEGEVNIQQEEIEAYQWILLESAPLALTFRESKSLATEAFQLCSKFPMAE